MSRTGGGNAQRRTKLAFLRFMWHFYQKKKRRRKKQKKKKKKIRTNKYRWYVDDKTTTPLIIGAGSTATDEIRPTEGPRISF